ncbi:23S rRNA (guanosine2251-2'-O)-methyltransferase [Alkalibacterium subtropicum]|uniref:23S rRNA (Guanosine2251-2'-O)-methyltransferase n=1 Tax=Alkalibacterium subtropicum TaxID=753702 RepID=A0A1I1LEQ5_9LACT|nr:23S rRNA (guanosine2251-2'-O)-methyltransferase [Alkalibacterium subtropicum]
MAIKKRNNNEKPKNDRNDSAITEDEMVYGRNPVLETLRSERDVNKLFVQDGLTDNKINKVVSEAKKRKVQLSFVPKTKLDHLSDGGNHQGLVLAASPVNYATIEDLFNKAEEKDEPPFFLLLDGIEDPHNLGSILRSADASGVHGVIIPKRRAVGLTSTVAKASAGAIEHVLVARVTNMAQTIDELKDRGLWIFGTDMQGKDYRYWDVESPVGLVIGSEGKGVSRLVKEKVDETLSIPMVGDVQSLNAGVASGLLMYEVFRKRNPL